MPSRPVHHIFWPTRGRRWLSTGLRLRRLPCGNARPTSTHSRQDKPPRNTSQKGKLTRTWQSCTAGCAAPCRGYLDCLFAGKKAKWQKGNAAKEDLTMPKRPSLAERMREVATPDAPPGDEPKTTTS